MLMCGWQFASTTMRNAAGSETLSLRGDVRDRGLRGVDVVLWGSIRAFGWWLSRWMLML